jgi:hypothetical protein
MDNKIQPSQIYIAERVTDQGSEDNTTYDEVDQNQNWGEECAVVELLHIGEVVFQSTIKDLFDIFKHDQQYYVILHSTTNIEECQKEFNVVNLNDSLDVLQETMFSPPTLT